MASSPDITDQTKSAADAARLLSDHFSSVNEEVNKFSKLQNDIVKSSEKISKLTEDITKRLIQRKSLLNQISTTTAKINNMSGIQRLLFGKEYDNLQKRQRLLNDTLGKMDIDISKKQMSLRLEERKNESLSTQLKYEQKIDDYTTKLKSSTGELGSIWEKISTTIKDIGVGGPLVVLLGLLISSVDRFWQMDAAAESFRKQTGLTISQASDLRKIAEQTNLELAGYGVSLEKAATAQAALVNTFGTQYNVTKESTGLVSLMAANLGVSEEHSAGALRNLMGIGRLSEKSAISVMKMGASLAKAGGVSINSVMQDVAKASEITLMMVRGSTVALLKATIQARRLGLSVEDIAKSARGLLNFESTFNDEMEASVLLGKNLNMMEARRKAMAGDLVGSQEEMLKQIKSAGEFSKMNVFQQESLVKLTGLSAEKINKMLIQEKALSQLTPKQKKDYEDMGKQLEKNVELTGDQLLKEREMQSVMSNLKNSWSAITTSLSTVFGPFVHDVAFLLEKLTSGISIVQKWIGGVEGKMNNITGHILSWVLAGVTFSLLLKKNILGSMWGMVKASGSWLKNMIAGSKALPKFTGPGIPRGGSESTSGFFSGLSKVNWKTLASSALVMVAIAGSIWILSKAVENFASLPLDGFIKGMSGIGVSAGILVLALWGISKVMASAAPEMYIAAGILIAFAASVGILSLAAMGFAKAAQMMIPFFKQMFEYDWKQYATVAAGLSLLSWTFAKLAITGSTGAVSMGIMAVALLGVAVPLKIISSSLSVISEKGLGAVDVFSKLASSVRDFATSLNGVSSLKIAALAGMMTVGAISASAVPLSPPPTVTSVESAPPSQIAVASNKDVVAAIKELNDNLLAGKIAVYLDGVKVHDAILRATEGK